MKLCYDIDHLDLALPSFQIIPLLRSLEQIMSNGTTNSVQLVSNGTDNPDEPQSAIETIVVDPDATIVELTACRLRLIEGLEGLNQIETLNMRQNLIGKIENISQLNNIDISRFVR